MTRVRFGQWVRGAMGVTLLTAIALGAGCNVGGFLGRKAGLDKPDKVAVTAEYRGLANKSVAVLVSADEKTMYDYPGAAQAIGRAVSSQLGQAVEGVRLVDPKQVAEFQKTNPYWVAVPPAELLQWLKVERLVTVDVVNYSTHEPGNAHVWRGVLVANVGVAESDSAEPSNMVYTKTVKTIFPPDKPVGVLNSDDRTIEIGMVTSFADKVARLFHDHEARPQ